MTLKTLKIASYVSLIAIYLYLNRRQYRKIWLQYKKFSLRKFLGFVTYVYTPMIYHWFYKNEANGRIHWLPFSTIDSEALEEAYKLRISSRVVQTDGGRYDVKIGSRKRFPIYWNGEPNDVRRCSWFFKRVKDQSFLPFPETIAEVLEEEFRVSFETQTWNRKIELPNGDIVVFQRPDILILLPPITQPVDAWGNTPHVSPKSSSIRRGMDEFDIVPGEPIILPDHLLLVVHGIGSFCDLKFRTVEEVVDQFRAISLKLVQAHYRTSYDNKLINRIEMLPINWHAKLHSEDTGIDKKLKNITLPSVPLIRDFINSTLSDILFYRSPKYCQIIVTAVGTELNRIYELFKSRNPGFHGSVFLAGHSLGSLILFDLLCYQEEKREQTLFVEDEGNFFLGQIYPPDSLKRRLSEMILEEGIHQPPLIYPRLQFYPRTLFAIGSPISMFITTIGLGKLGEDFSLPTCPGFFNIFHPYDPVANRIETLVNPEFVHLEPVLIPHHTGGKRMHLQFKENMAKLKAELHEKWRLSMIQLGLLAPQDPTIPPNVETENETVEDLIDDDFDYGILNRGRRIDYVLQEAPIESFNEYIFALTMSSHVCYWESEDTILLILKEIFSSMGVDPDDPDLPLTAITSPNHSLGSATSVGSNTYNMCMNPVTLKVIERSTSV